MKFKQTTMVKIFSIIATYEEGRVLSIPTDPAQLLTIRHI
jgi:hypothetical protein